MKLACQPYVYVSVLKHFCLFAGLNKLIEKLDKRNEKRIKEKKSPTFQSYPRIVRSPSKATPSRSAPQWAVHRSYWNQLNSAASSEASVCSSSTLPQPSASQTHSTVQSTPTSHTSHSQRMLTFDLSAPEGTNCSSSSCSSSDSEFDC